LLLLLTVSTASAAPASGGAKKLVCWKDERGNTVCGDSVPPRYAKGERRVIDAQGRLVQVLPREATAAELAERREREQLRVESSRAERERAAYDRFLVQSYVDVADMVRARDERLATIDGRAGLARKTLDETQAALAELRRRANAKDAEPEVRERARSQVGEFEIALADQAQSLANLGREREKTCRDASRDIRRFQELKTGVASFVGDCPAEAVLAAERGPQRAAMPAPSP
jgi:hypothetical protein